MKEIPLTQGYVALVDDADYDRVMQFTWHVNTHGNAGNMYAHRGVRPNITVVLGSFIMGNPINKAVVYMDGNGLNCQRSNLRVVTQTEVARKRNISITNNSGYKGVSWNKQIGKWRADININYKQIYLGLYKCIECAAVEYNRAAKRYFGEFAFQNEIKEHDCGKFGED